MIVNDAPDAALMEHEFRAAIAAERRADRVGAAAFASACRNGDVDQMLATADFLSDATVCGWRLAMLKVGRLPTVSAEIQAAFLNIWIESKHMPLMVGHRPTMAQALRVMMPSVELSEPLTLYRGASARERASGTYGFSWSMQREIAERFAEQAALSPGGGVLLTTEVAPGAVHLRREPEDYYDEGEVVVDPYRLGKVQVLARLSWKEQQ